MNTHHTSRGERNNNPLNIRRSTDRWVGASEVQTDTGFVQFKSLAYGYRAAWKILQSYYDRFCAQGKGFTVRNIIYRWAPPSDGNATEAYIRKVLQLSSLGGKENLLPPDNPDSYYRLSKLLTAMTSIECGIPMARVHTEAICQGYLLAFPENKEAVEDWFKTEDEYWNWSPHTDFSGFE